MIFFGHVTPAGILELHHLELYGDLLKGRLARQSLQQEAIGAVMEVTK